MDACAHCSARGVPLLRCGGCKTELFCGVKCQRAGRASHKAFCVGVSEFRGWASTTGLDCCPYCRANSRARAVDIPASAKFLANQFYKSTVLEDLFPEVTTERMWRIQTGTPLSQDMLSTWQKLLCMGSSMFAREQPLPYVCPTAVAAAIAEGTLPALFERAARGCAAFARGEYLRMQRLVDVGFGGIPWDVEFLKRLPELLRRDPGPEDFKRVWTFVDTAAPHDDSVNVGGGFVMKEL